MNRHSIDIEIDLGNVPTEPPPPVPPPPPPEPVVMIIKPPDQPPVVVRPPDVERRLGGYIFDLEDFHKTL